MSFSAERVKNEVLNRVQHNTIVDYVTQNAETTLSLKIKNIFGKEFYINGCRSVSKYNKSLFDFIKKYYNDFEMDSNDTIPSFINIVPLEPRTMMYIATGRFIPGKLESHIMDESINADMYIYIFGKKSHKYIKELQTIIESIKHGQDHNFYSVNKLSSNDRPDISHINFSPRYMSSLIYSNGELDIIKEHIDRYNNSKQLYIDKQLTYKTGILLYGNPGTGKSSIVKAIATEYDRQIISVDCSNIDQIDFSSLTMLINNEDEEKYVVLFEDIDTLYLNREEKATDGNQKNYNDIINKLLQFLDSNQSPTDVIFVATTNYPERLDKALIRSGRFDLKLEVKELDERDVRIFAHSFGLDSENDVKEIIKQYAGDGEKPSLYNQSKLQNIILGLIKVNDTEE